MTCSECVDLFAARVEGLLDEVAERQLGAHLADCEACRKSLDETRRLVRRLDEDRRGVGVLSITPLVMDRIVHEQALRLRRFGMMRYVAQDRRRRGPPGRPDDRPLARDAQAQRRAHPCRRTLGGPQQMEDARDRDLEDLLLSAVHRTGRCAESVVPDPEHGSAERLQGPGALPQREPRRGRKGHLRRDRGRGKSGQARHQPQDQDGDPDAPGRVVLPPARAVREGAGSGARGSLAAGDEERRGPPGERLPVRNPQWLAG